MFTGHIALVSQTGQVKLSELTKCAAAIQKQVTRDVRQEWKVDATVDAFDKLTDVPLGYWPVVIRSQIGYRAQGIHLNKANGQPFALVKYSPQWTLTTSHECLEMLVDPSGNRMIAGDSVKPGQGRVNYLVEVCDPSEGAEFAYSVNGILVSDFYTPHFFEPIAASGVRYSYTGALTAPHQVLDGGYLSWWVPATGHLWQQFVVDGASDFVDQGPVEVGALSSMRRASDIGAAKYRESKQLDSALDGAPRRGLMMSAMGMAGVSGYDAAVEAAGNRLQTQIEDLIKGTA